jgi:hypothetical protein
MYTSKDFGYKKNTDGFTLYSEGEDLKELSLDKYEFKVKK